MKLMKKCFAGLIYSLLLTISIQASAPLSGDSLLIAVGDRFFDRRNFTAAITEYQRLLFFNPHPPLAPYAFYKMGQSYLHLGQYRRAVLFLRRALMFPAKKNTRLKLRLQLALAFLEGQRYDLAALEFFKMESRTQDETLKLTAQLFRGLIYIRQQNWKEARKVLRKLNDHPRCHFQETLQAIDRLLTRLMEKPRLKNPRTARLLSTLLPGAGQMYTGHFFLGVDALVLNGANTYLVWQTIVNRNYLDLGLSVALLWLRYYEGSRIRAEMLAHKVNREYQERMTRRLYRSLQELADCLPAFSTRLTWEDFIP